MPNPQHVTPDPHEWLEVYSQETEHWERDQDRATQEMLDAWPHRDQLRVAVATLPASRGVLVPWVCGGVTFTASGSAVQADARLVFECAAPVSVLAMWPGPDARQVVIATTVGAQEAGELRLFDVDTGATVGAALLYTAWTDVAWLPDASAFVATSIDFHDGRTVGAVWRVDRSGAATRVGVEHEGLDLRPSVSVDGWHVVVSVGTTQLRPRFLVNADSNSARALPAVAGHLHGFVDGGDYLAVSTVGAPRGRLVRAPLDRLDDLNSWREIVPEGDATMRAVSVVDARIVLSELVDGCSRLRIITADGASLGEVPLPNDGVGVAASGATPLPGVAMFHNSRDSSEITFSFSSPGSPPTPYSFDVATSALRVLGQQTGLLTTSTRISAGVDAPDAPAAWVTRRSDIARTERPAALVLVYGGWNIPNSPQYSPATAAFLAAGGLVVHAIVRGGGERGETWWTAGRRENKQATFDDLYAVVEALAAGGVVDRDRIALHGGSAGGMAAAVAATQRPDLWAVVAATAPLLDLQRVAGGPNADPSTIGSIRDELGDDPDVLARYSPYENVHDHLPPLLIGVAADDVRTPAWHGRKFVARAHAAGSEQVHLRVWRDVGHGTGRPAGNQITNDWLAFVMMHLGLEPA